MDSRAVRLLLLVVLVLVLVPAFARANSASPQLWSFFGRTGQVVPLLTSLLAAVVERPFAARGGVARRTLLHSMVANVLSHVLGLVTMEVLLRVVRNVRWFDELLAATALLLLWGLLVSIVSESGYYALVTRGRLGLRWIALGNVVSLLVLVALYGGVLFFVAR